MLERFLEMIQKTFCGGRRGGGVVDAEFIIQPEGCKAFICQFRLELGITQSIKHSVLHEYN